MAIVTYRFVRTDSWTGKAIRLLTLSKWNHVDIIIEGDKCLGALNDGVVYHNGLKKACLIEDVEMEFRHKDMLKIMEWYKAQEGKKYDWVGVFTVGLFSNWHDENKWFCSELAAKGLINIGIDIADQKASRVTPGELYRAMIEYNNDKQL